MNPIAASFRANEGLVVAVALLLGFPLALGIVALVMRGAGASLRPIALLGALFAPLGISFLLVSLIRARQPSAGAPAVPSLTVRDGRFADPDRIYGHGITPDMIRDAAPLFPWLLGEAGHAEIGMGAGGETVLVAQFADPGAAGRAAAAYWKAFQFTGTSGDEVRGWRGRRAQIGDYAEMLRTDDLLLVWTAPTAAAAASARQAVASAGVGPAPREPLLPALQPLGARLRRPEIKAAGVVLLVGTYLLIFFRGAAWAGSVPAAPGVPALAGAALGARLNQVNALDVPFRIEPGPDAGEYFATWRYADARWLDLARVRGLRKTYRLRLRLDESTHTVRVTDYTAEYDWSAGRTGAGVAWKAALGIGFFQVERQRVYGLQLGSTGQFQPVASYEYRFDLREMKSPLMAAVTGSGWTWRPVVCPAPRWLQWLTG